MFQAISNSRKYDWVLTIHGAPDMRFRQNRENLLEMAIEFDSALANERDKNRRFACDKGDVVAETTCVICTEEMCGRVTLKCGHEMCPECFANHARVNHMCPFCRDEFAPKREVRDNIPRESIVAMANQLCDPAEESDYFMRSAQIIQGTDLVEGTHYIEYVIKMNAVLLGRRVAEWYDA